MPYRWRLNRYRAALAVMRRRRFYRAYRGFYWNSPMRHNTRAMGRGYRAIRRRGYRYNSRYSA